MAQIKINNLYYKNIINNLNLNIEQSTWISVIGTGKTTLLKLLTGELESNGSIIVNNTIINDENIHKLHDIVYYLDTDASNSFVSGTVLGNILFGMSKFPNSVQDKRLQTMAKYFDIQTLLYKKPNNLSAGQKQLIAFISAIILNPEILIIDDSFNMMDGLTKKKVYALIKKYVKQGMIVINMVNNSDELMYGDKTIILDKTISILQKEDLTNEHIFRNINYNLPFILNLSNKLKYYKMLDKYYFDTSKLVNSIWK